MKAKKREGRAAIRAGASSFMLQPSSSDYAASDSVTPPARYAATGMHAGPGMPRGESHIAVKKTCDPAGVAAGNVTSKLVRVTLPCQVQPFMSAGGVAPMNENRLAE